MSNEITPETRKTWAAKLKVSEQYLYQCISGRRDMNPIEARRIEDLTGGVITRQMLCQKTWRGIWPELLIAA
jgi:DNA-binding transcriptional regulator YdaS (Cro superfamily)